MTNFAFLLMTFLEIPRKTHQSLLTFSILYFCKKKRLNISLVFTSQILYCLHGLMCVTVERGNQEIV